MHFYAAKNQNILRLVNYIFLSIALCSHCGFFLWILDIMSTSRLLQLSCRFIEQWFPAATGAQLTMFFISTIWFVVFSK
jgi:hypothetical protein